VTFLSQEKAPFPCLVQALGQFQELVRELVQARGQVQGRR
jgi:hypothetical protein